MAQKIQTLFIDDLDGTDYEIDLSARHGDELCAALGKYVEHARKVGGTARGRAPAADASPAADTVAVRAWSRDIGYDIKNRGPRARQPRRQVPGSDRNSDQPGQRKPASPSHPACRRAGDAHLGSQAGAISGRHRAIQSLARRSRYELELGPSNKQRCPAMISASSASRGRCPSVERRPAGQGNTRAPPVTTHSQSPRAGRRS
jgi:hypothetical protein